MSWPNLFSHLATFNDNGKCSPYPRVDGFLLFLVKLGPAHGQRTEGCFPNWTTISADSGPVGNTPFCPLAITTKQESSPERLLGVDHPNFPHVPTLATSISPMGSVLWPSQQLSQKQRNKALHHVLNTQSEEKVRNAIDM